ncbi:hypothetical protein ACP70R_045877 [Stipagrostis hirtigluma subsp. patula]
MARGRAAMSLIANARARARTFAQRKAGLLKKARELATLCAVDVAVACGGPDGGGAPAEVWESRDGVLERYRALPAEERARHTHLGYAQAELGKERAKLARARQAGPDALAPWDAALDGMSLEVVQAVLGDIDTAILATAERRKALGLPGDAAADGQLQHAVPLGQGVPFVGDEVQDMESWVRELMQGGDGEPRYAQHLNGDVDMYGNQLQLQMPSNGGGEHINQLPLQMPGNGGGEHINQLQLQMPGNGGGDHGQFAWDACQPNAIVYPGCGFQCGDSSFVDMNCYHMAAPGNASADDGWLSLAMWDQSSCNAVVPVVYPSLDIAGNSVYAPAKHHAMDTGDNFTGAPAMGAGGYFKDANGYDYGTPCLAAGDFLCPDAGQHFGLDKLHYLSDVADGMLF